MFKYRALLVLVSLLLDFCYQFIDGNSAKLDASIH